MSKFFSMLITLFTIAALTVTSLAQRPRLSETNTAKDRVAQPQPAAAPLTNVNARYEGGVAGFSKKMVGSLSLDNANRDPGRLAVRAARDLDDTLRERLAVVGQFLRGLASLVDKVLCTLPQLSALGRHELGALFCLPTDQFSGFLPGLWRQ